MMSILVLYFFSAEIVCGVLHYMRYLDREKGKGEKWKADCLLFCKQQMVKVLFCKRHCYE